MRSALALAAASVAAVAAVIASREGEGAIVPLFLGLTAIGLGGAWATREPMTHMRKTAARAGALVWLGAATWIGAVLLAFQSACGCSFGGPMPPEATYLGLPATAYHLAGVYLGAALMTVAAFSRALAR
jgi:hypothetical protein